MSGSFFAINIAQTALTASQVMMDVASQNIANDETPGYSRESANLAAIPADVAPTLGGPIAAGASGIGVTAESVTRARASYLDSIYRQTAADSGLYTTSQNYLSAVQSLFGEPGSSGLSATMNQFFSDWQTLSQNPSDPAFQTTVQQDGEALASQIQSIWSGLQSVAQQATNQATSDAGTVNTYLQEIAQLNGTIATAQTEGGQPNVLLDQRSYLVDQLSSLIGITSQTTSQQVGSATITQTSISVAGPSGPITLVNGQSYGSLAVSGGPSGLTVTATDTGGTSTAISPTTGSIGAAAQFVNVDANPNAAGPPPSIAYQLNQVVSQLTSDVNTQHAAGYYYDTTTSSWNTGENFFTSQGGGAITAANIEVNPSIAANAGDIAAGATPASGDGQNALAIADIAQQPQGPLAQYAAFISGLGSQVDLSQNLGNTAQTLLEQIQNQKSQVSGVSINQEMVTMVQAQAMYQAAGKIAETSDAMLQSLINAINP